ATHLPVGQDRREAGCASVHARLQRRRQGLRRPGHQDESVPGEPPSQRRHRLPRTQRPAGLQGQ
ncbi:hypothetical protein CRUP_035663, partial [Coryphaenoides rupestris]